MEGFSDKCETEFFFENKVTRNFESPRVTKPYKDEQCEAIYNLRFKVEEDLIKNVVH
ncbi:transglutaminase family protein, partial [Aliarcobacter butzleri]